MSHTSELLRQSPIGNTEFLLERARAGSEAAWREIWRRYRTMLVFHVRATILGISRPDVDDLLQSVLAKVYVHIQGFEYRGEGSFRRWLARLVTNASKNELKTRAIRGRVLRTESGELAEVEDLGAAERAELSAERRALFEQLGALEEEDRDLLIMREFERLSWEAIGEVLDCSIEKARSDHALAFQRLQRRLGG